MVEYEDGRITLQGDIFTQDCFTRNANELDKDANIFRENSGILLLATLPIKDDNDD